MLIMDKPLSYSKTYPDGSHACTFGKGALLIVHGCTYEQLMCILSDTRPSVRKDSWVAYPLRINLVSKVNSRGEFCIVHGNIYDDTVWDTEGLWHTSLLETNWVISCDKTLVRTDTEISYVSSTERFYGSQVYQVNYLESGEDLRIKQSGAFLTVFETSKEYPTQFDLREACYRENKLYFQLHNVSTCKWNAYAIAAKTCRSERNAEYHNLSKDPVTPGYISGYCPDYYIEKVYGEGQSADQTAIMLCKMLTGGYTCPDYSVDSIKSLVTVIPERDALKITTGASQVIKVKGNFQIGQRPLATQPLTPRLTGSHKIWQDVLIAAIQHAKVTNRFITDSSDCVLEIGGRKYHIASEVYMKLFKPYV